MENIMGGRERGGGREQGEREALSERAEGGVTTTGATRESAELCWWAQVRGAWEPWRWERKGGEEGGEWGEVVKEG